MSVYTEPLQALIDELNRLPGIGPKSAQRIAFHLLKIPKEDAARLAESIVVAKDRVHWCRVCFNVCDSDTCQFCADDGRDGRVVCVVEEARDIVAIERSGAFKGRYHVLQGAISPIEGIGPEQLRVRELVKRLEDDAITELILATNPNVEGDATASYLARLIKPIGVRVTRLASGLPQGGDLEFADEVTLGHALEGRREL